jgi:replication factor C subunit 3/5
MFFIDKYDPRKTNKPVFHEQLINKLSKMSKDESIPHIILHGPEGSGKKTLLNMFLEMIFDKSVNNVVNTEYVVSGSGSTKNTVIVKQSDHHIVIKPNNTNFDRYLLQDVVKKYAKLRPLNVFKKNRGFKVVVIDNVDLLSHYAQTSLRRTMEVYSHNCRFIMWSRVLSKVFLPLRSRCMCVRVASPSDSDIFANLFRISAMEKIQMTGITMYQIVKLANGNIKHALWMLELHKYGKGFQTDYDVIINEIKDYLLSGDPRPLLRIRELVYSILITNIDPTDIIVDLTDLLLDDKSLSDRCKKSIVKIAAKSQMRLSKARRNIIHIELFTTNVMKIVYLENNKTKRKTKSKAKTKK